MRKSKWLRNSIVALTVISLLLITWYYADFRRYALVLPSGSEVIGMRAALQPDDDDPNALKEFPVPSEHMQKILSALVPADRDWTPAKWQVAGHLHVDCKDGNSYRVDLYWTRKSVGAFSVHRPDWPRNAGLFVSNYFRGGSEPALREALTAAYAAHEAEVKKQQPKGE
jgi:hypothetical protein